MARKETARPSPAGSRRPSSRSAVMSAPPYVTDPRWSTPVRPRNDLLVIDITDRFAPSSTSGDEDPLALTA